MMNQVLLSLVLVKPLKMPFSISTLWIILKNKKHFEFYLIL